MERTDITKSEPLHNAQNNANPKSVKLREIKSFSELFSLLTAKRLAKAASVLLFIWILAPVIAMLVNLFSGNLAKLESPTFMPGQKAFFIVLLQTGFLGCLLGLAVFIKSIIQAKKAAVRFKEYLAENIVPILLFAMLLWSILSCAFSSNTSLSFFGTSYRKDGLLTYFAYCGIFCCGFVIRKQDAVKRLLSFFVIIAAFLSVFVLKNSTQVDMLFGLSSNAAIFLNTNHFGYYICIALMCAATLFAYEKASKLKKTLWIVLFTVMAAALIKNKSFGPYLAVSAAIAAGLVLTLWLKRQHFKWMLLVALAFVAASIGMTLMGYSAFSGFSEVSSDIVDIVKDSEEAVYAGSNRWELWENGFKFITQKPILGFGPENLGEQYKLVLTTHITDRPHNELIQYAASLGIPAALLYLSSLVLHCKNLIKKRKNIAFISVGLACVLLAYLASSMFGNTMFYTSPYFFMILGFSAGMLRETKTGRST